MKKTLFNTLVTCVALIIQLCASTSLYANLASPQVVIDSIVTIQPSCGLDNGRISIYASGSDHIFYSINNGLTFHEENIFDDMAPGDYSIQVTDGLACVINTSLQLTNGPAVEIANVDITCHEQNVSADILVDPQNGILPYHYEWRGPGNFASTEENLFAVTPGEYMLTITDNVGCRVLDTIQVPVCCGLSQGLDLNCPTDLYLECGNPDNDQIISNWINSVTATDGLNNSLIVENDFDISQTAFCEDHVTIRFNTKDQCDNATNCSANIFIADINIPTINCPGDVTLDYVPGENDANIEAWLSSATASDNCTGAFVVHNYDPDNIIDCLNGSTIEVTFTALDQCQNSDMCSSFLTITPAPLVNLMCLNNLGLECDSEDPNAEIEAWIENIVAVDDQGNHVEVLNDFVFQDSYECGQEYNIQFSALNYCGSSLNCNGVIQIVDTKSPEINCDDHLNISAYANDKPEQIEEWLENFEATDNCSEAQLFHNFDHSAFNYACGNADSQVVRFEAYDECGNLEVCLLSINIIASELTYNTPVPLELDCDNNYQVELDSWLNQATAIDQFGEVTYLENNLDPSLLNCFSQIEVTFNHTDPCGEVFENTSLLSLVDNKGPEISCPEPLLLHSYEIPLFDFEDWLNQFEAVDQCSEAFVYNDFDKDNLSNACQENQKVNFVAEDDCGNISECQVEVRVIDFAPPSISCPEDISLDTSNPFAKEELDDHLAKIISNSNSTLSFEYSENLNYENLKEVFTSRDIEVKVTATNECDDAVSCYFNIHINAEADIFAPTIFSPNGDGDNDRFTIYGNNHLNTVIKLSIYDRLGNRMQHLTNIPINHPSLGWDGTFRGRDCEMGVYAYHALILDWAGNQIEFVGSITLVR